MKIQLKLVFDKNSNEIIGFVDLGEEELNISSFGSTELATMPLFSLLEVSHRFEIRHCPLLNQRCDILPGHAIVLESCARIRAFLQPLGLCCCI